MLPNVKSTKGSRVCNVCSIKLKASMANAAKNISTNISRSSKDNGDQTDDDPSNMIWRETISAGDWRDSDPADRMPFQALSPTAAAYQYQARVWKLFSYANDSKNICIFKL
jgi:hypothetical protein